MNKIFKCLLWAVLTVNRCNSVHCKRSSAGRRF
uniref:Uncharacterized protein n=1 Tax=Anguilla anguilla TaxID=7936 RepID=A0A0E9SEN5_ANGAN